MRDRDLWIEGDVAYLPLSRGYVAVLDADDAEKVNGFKWTADVQAGGTIIYAHRMTRVNGARKKVSLHRLIMNAPAGVFVDHIDCDGLNNRKSNLRLVTPAQNKMNCRPSSKSEHGFKGIWRDKGTNKWRASIKHQGKASSLGFFETPEEASAAYFSAAKNLFGEFARAK